MTVSTKSLRIAFFIRKVQMPVTTTTNLNQNAHMNNLWISMMIV